MDYLIFSLSLLLVYVALGLLLHVQFGLLGIANFGVVGFWGLGMYAVGVFQVQFDMSFLDAMGLLAVLMALVSYGIGRLLLRCDSQAILCGTLAFSVIVAMLVISEKWLTEGVVGLGTIRYPLRIGAGTEVLYFFVLLGCVALLQYGVLKLHVSHFARVLIAIRDNEELAASLGKDTFGVKLTLFTITCTLMGLVGGMSAPLNQFLTPNMIVPGITFAVWISLALGGKEHALGATLGVFATFGLFDILIETYLPVSPELAVVVPNMKLFVYGVVLVLVLMYRPRGLLPDETFSPDRIVTQIDRRAARAWSGGSSAVRSVASKAQSSVSDFEKRIRGGRS